MGMLLELIKLSWKGIRRQLWLVAVLAGIFLALTFGIGPAARSLLSQGVDFAGITLAVSAPEGEGQLMEQLTRNMRDIREFASLVSMEEGDALRALEEGEITAVLLLPEGFLSGVLDGTNPDVTLVVAPDSPLEALLTWWVGRSAADMLTSAQHGIYTVLELYPARNSDDWERAKDQINLEFISLVLNRQRMIPREHLEPTGAIPMGVHYALSLLLFLIMALPTMLSPAFGEEQLPLRRRLAVLGYGAAAQYIGGVLVCIVVVLALILVPGLMITGGNFLGCLPAALFGACWAGLCWGMTRTSGGCGWLSLGAGAVLLFFCGGVLPPALLPEWIRRLGNLLPLGTLRELWYLPAEDWETESLLVAGIWMVLMMALGMVLYRKRLGQKEETE